MNTISYIPLTQLCVHYEVEMTFFTNLKSFGLLEIITVEAVPVIDLDKISSIEKMIRLHKEMNLNFEAIDVVLNLLSKIEALQEDLMAVNNKLRRYERD